MSLLLDALKEAEKSRKGLESTAESTSPVENQDVVLDLDLEQSPEPEQVAPEPQPPTEKGKENSEEQIPQKQTPKKTGTTNTPDTKTSASNTSTELDKEHVSETGAKVATDITATLSVVEEASPIPATRPKAENRPRVAANVFQNQEPVTSQPESKYKPRVLLLLLLLLLVLTGFVIMYFVLSTKPESTFPQSRHNTQSKTSDQILETSSLPKKTSASTTQKSTTPSTTNENQLSLTQSEQVSRNDEAAVLTSTVENPQQPQAINKQSNSPVLTPPLNQVVTSLSATNQGQGSTNDSNSGSKPNTFFASKPGIQISKRKLSARSQSSLTAANQALNTGDLGNAEMAYRQALKESPDNVTAMSALANLLAQQGKIQEAKILFLKTLKKDPENLIAKTGLINIQAADPTNLSAGSELKQLLTEHPEQAHVHASLGNFHARRNEWPAAQTAYFEAFALDSENPDYAFNLAISLDQIGKPEIAVNYYEKAIELFGNRPSQFSKSDAERRLNELKGLNKSKELDQPKGTAP